MKKIFGLPMLGLLLVAATVTTASAQSTVSASDIQRLQDRVYDAGSDVARVRARNADQAAQLQAELDELREEVIYLKVKLRKDGTVDRSEYTSVRDRIDQVASRAREGGSWGSTSSGSSYPSGSSTTTGSGSYGSGTSGTGSSGAGTSTTGTYGTGGTRGTRGSSQNALEIPAGTELDVRLQTPLNSGTAQVEQRFEATTAVDLRGENNNQVLVPAGSVLRGVISDVKRAGRVERKASLTVSFDQITVSGRNYPIRATVAPFEGEGVRGDASKIGTGAGVGAIIGGILGGFKGALAGILIGGGGVIAATEGQEVNLPAGTVLRVRLDSPLQLR